MFDPIAGRFLEEDPIDFAAGDPNLFRYVGNSPTNHTDPSGMQPPEDPIQRARELLSDPLRTLKEGAAEFGRKWKAEFVRGIEIVKGTKVIDIDERELFSPNLAARLTSSLTLGGNGKVSLELRPATGDELRKELKWTEQQVEDFQKAKLYVYHATASLEVKDYRVTRVAMHTEGEYRRKVLLGNDLAPQDLLLDPKSARKPPQLDINLTARGELFSPGLAAIVTKTKAPTPATAAYAIKGVINLNTSNLVATTEFGASAEKLDPLDLRLKPQCFYAATTIRGSDKWFGSELRVDYSAEKNRMNLSGYLLVDENEHQKIKTQFKIGVAADLIEPTTLRLQGKLTATFSPQSVLEVTADYNPKSVGPRSGPVYSIGVRGILRFGGGTQPKK